MPRLAIVVPVYNGLADVDRLLGSLARHRPPDSEILLVDDASTDARVLPRLREFERAQPHVRVLASSTNRGFIVSVNRGAAEAAADADLVFLNTDTEVTHGWAEALVDALASHEGAAVACPLSNNATILSVPGFQQENQLPFDWSADRMATLVRRSAAETRSVPIPTPVGFCMLVRRAAWRQFGPFDEAFGRGYGEEDDFGQKLQAAGHAIVCAPRAFVYHRGGASFGNSAELSGQKRVNGELLVSRWPDYNIKTRAWCLANPLRPVHERIWHALLVGEGRRRAHVLHFARRWELEGKLRENFMAIASASAEFAVHTIAVPMDDRGAWLDAFDFEFEPPLRVTGLMHFQQRMPDFLAASPADLVHFHDNASWIPADLVEIARRERAVLVTPGETPDPARCAEMYRRASPQ